VTRLIVCDTGPLLHLSEAGMISLLQQAGDILIPPVVNQCHLVKDSDCPELT